jgi:hypothetical protein
VWPIGYLLIPNILKYSRIFFFAGAKFRDYLPNGWIFLAVFIFQNIVISLCFYTSIWYTAAHIQNGRIYTPIITKICKLEPQSFGIFTPKDI